MGNYVRNLVSKTKFAEMAGVTYSAVIKQIKKSLSDAVVGPNIDINHPDAKKYLSKRSTINKSNLTDRVLEAIKRNPAWTINSLSLEMNVGSKKMKECIERLETTVDLSRYTKETGGKKLAGKDILKEIKKKSGELYPDPNNNGYEIPEDIREYSHMTLSELIQRFGTDIQFVDWLKATKQIEDIMTARLKNAATKKELVSRKMIQIGVLDQIENCHNKLLTDGAKTIARRVIAMREGGRRIEDCEVFASKQISSFIKPMKEKIAKALTNA